MLYNKNRMRKTNDKKVLHKVGKNWKVVSIALLMALGGGAVLANNHSTANASSTYDQAQSLANSGQASMGPGVASQVQSLNVMPAINGADNTSTNTDGTSTNNTSTGNDNTNASTNTADNTATPSSSVNYLPTNGGSAAYNHDAANQAESDYNSNSDNVTSYTNAVDERFPQYVKQLESNYATDNSEATSNQAVANMYNSYANEPDQQSIIDQMASDASQAPGDYMNNVENDYNDSSNDVLNASQLASQMNVVSNYAATITNLQSDSTLRQSYENDASAMGNNVSDLSNESASASNALSSLNDKLFNIDTPFADYNIAQSNDAIATSNNASDKAFISSLSKSLGFNDNFNVNDDIQDLANSGAKPTTSLTNSDNKQVSLDSATQSALSQAVDDTSAMNAYAQTASVNPSLINMQISEAQVTVSAISSQYDEAVDDEDKASLLGSNGITLANLFGSTASTGVLSDADYSLASSAVSSAMSGKNSASMSSVISDVASTAQDNYTNTSSTFTSFESASDVNVVLASYLSSSYANNATNATDNASNARTTLLLFYNQFHPDYVQDLTNTENDAIAEINSNALAMAFARKVYNYAPKLLYVKKNLLLHTSPTFTKKNYIIGIKKGTCIVARGVGFTRDGYVRYLINYKGHEGYVTSDKNYVKQHYLKAWANRKVAVMNVRPICEYKATKYNHKTFYKHFKKGHIFYGSVVAEPDSNFNNNLVYGGFSRIRLHNNNYITANLNYVKLVNTSNVKKSKKNKKSKGKKGKRSKKSKKSTQNQGPQNLPQYQFAD